MADWEEIKRLAADFQRAQLSSTVLKLSERNCIEIVQKLVELNLLDIIYTTDGKEYLTHQELIKEIREELIVRGGRVNLVDLQAALNVDFSHIEAKANDIVKTDKTLNLILGQLIDQSYIASLAEEINDTLQDQGQLTLAQLAKTYDLPGDFLSEIIRDHLGSVIKGQVDDYDKDVIFTEAFVNRHKAIIRGAFSAITRPTPLSAVLNTFSLQDRLFFSILEELVSSSCLAGIIAGGRQERAQYIPEIYTRSQNEWVDNFFKQNGYLEYDSLARLGISDPKTYIKKRFKSETLQYLSSCCIGKLLEERVEAEIDEALNDGGWLDIMPSLPSICTEKDASQLLTRILRSKPGTRVFCDSVVTSDKLFSSCQKVFDAILPAKAEAVARSNPGLLMPDKGKNVTIHDDGPSKEDKKEQRRKKASTGKSGGGTQGREVRTKSTKKKVVRGRGDPEDSDDDAGPAGTRGPQDTDFMTLEAIEDELRKVEALVDCPEELISGIAENLHRPLNKQFMEMARSVFLQTAGGATGAARKKTHGDLSEKINNLWMNIKLFEKSLKFFTDDTQGHLTKHMLKTICTDVTNMVFNAVASDHMVAVQDSDTLTSESRLKVLGKLTDEKTKALLSRLHATLGGKSLEDFLNQLNTCCDNDYLAINLKKADKKKERQLIFHHRQALAEELRQESDPALALHLASVMLFLVYTQAMLHTPGRCVPQVITFLKGHMTPETHTVLVQCQDLVMKQLRLQNDKDSVEKDEALAELRRQLEALLPSVREIALTVKKGNGPQTPED